MGVQIRGKKFHYRFRLDGVDHSGACPGCEIPDGATAREIASIKKAALRFEAEEKARAEKAAIERKNTEAEIKHHKTVRALVEDYRYILTGGKPIALREAYAVAEAKPSRRESKSSYAGLRQSYWNDFVEFVNGEFPEVADMSAVCRCHCEAYVKHLVDHGRYNKRIQFKLRQGHGSSEKEVSYTQRYALSGKTIKEIAGACRWVFSRVEEDAGLYRNPWDNVVLPEQTPIAREVFTAQELLLIWNGIQTDHFNYVLFFVAANSGLTEGDICTLRWDDLDLANGFLRRDRRKTGTPIELPLLPELAEYLLAQPRSGEYIFPEHAAMYLRQQSCVSERVKSFLNKLGIVTTVEVPGHRAVSVKDLHSMRHVFAYRAKRAGIPESVLKKYLGHKIIAMTQHYADHDTAEELRAEIKKLPALFAGEDGNVEAGADMRRKLAELAYTLPLQRVEALLDAARLPELEVHEYKITGD